MSNDPTTCDDEKTVHQQRIPMTVDDALALSDGLNDEIGPPMGWALAIYVLAAEVRRLRGEAVLLNDMVKDADERALDDARAEVSEGVVALEGTCRDLSVKLSESEAEVRRLREENDRLLVKDDCSYAAIQRLSVDAMQLRETQSKMLDLFEVERKKEVALSTKLARVEALAARYESVPHDACATSSVAKYIRAALRDDPQPSAAPTPKGEPYNGW